MSARPRQMIEIANQFGEYVETGFVLYSEGFGIAVVVAAVLFSSSKFWCKGDDVNKMAFVAAASWGVTVDRFLADYERLFAVPAALLAGLERNWQGPVSLARVQETGALARSAWQAARGSFLMRNARLQMQVYRAELDLFVAMQLVRQQEAVAAARTLLCKANEANVFVQLDAALSVLRADGVLSSPPSSLRELASMLFQGVGLQLSYEFAGRDESGNSLDTATNVNTGEMAKAHSLSFF